MAYAEPAFCGGAEPGEAENHVAKVPYLANGSVRTGGHGGHPIPSVRIPYPVLQKGNDVAQLIPFISPLYQPFSISSHLWW
jgi:hypothetical protein